MFPIIFISSFNLMPDCFIPLLCGGLVKLAAKHTRNLVDDEASNCCFHTIFQQSPTQTAKRFFEVSCPRNAVLAETIAIIPGSFHKEDVRNIFQNARRTICGDLHV